MYFPESGVISWVTKTTEENLRVEVATVGREGMIGIPVYLGAEQVPGMAFSQVPGQAMRMPAKAFLAATQRSESFRRILNRYIQSLFVLISQSSACNRLHTTEQRCARWLLMTHDRVDNDRFQLTQEFLGQMLGVRRATVNGVAGALQRAGVISYTRGIVTVRQRKKLEAEAL